MKKIAIIISALNNGGAEKSSILLAEKLNNKNQSVDLISLTKNSKNLKNKKINLISLNKTRAIFSIFELYECLRNNKYDCIITGLSHLNFITLFLNFFK